MNTAAKWLLTSVQNVHNRSRPREYHRDILKSNLKTWIHIVTSKLVATIQINVLLKYYCLHLIIAIHVYKRLL